MATKKMKFDNPLEKSALFTQQEEPKEQPAQAKTEEKPKKMGRPRKTDIIRDNAAQAGLTEEYTRATFILKVEALDALKDYAYTNRITIKDALDEILTKFFSEYDGELLKHKK